MIFVQMKKLIFLKDMKSKKKGLSNEKGKKNNVCGCRDSSIFSFISIHQ